MIRGHNARIALVVLELSNEHEAWTRLELMLLYTAISLIESRLDGCVNDVPPCFFSACIITDGQGLGSSNFFAATSDGKRSTKGSIVQDGEGGRECHICPSSLM